MKILVTSSIVDFPRLSLAVEKVRNKMNGTSQVVSGEDIPWDSILMTEGSWDGVYAWVARVYDGLVLLETEENGLGRGTYEMAKLFIANGKAVGVLREDEIKEVKEVRVFDRNNWKTAYGVAVTNG